jgi:hypothetical protein
VFFSPFTYYNDEGKVTKESASGGSAKKRNKIGLEMKMKIIKK